MLLKITKQNIHLLISAPIVIAAAGVYSSRSKFFFQLHFTTTDELSFLRSIVVVYLSFGLLWLFALAKPKLLFAALITNMLFMLSLGIGRIISFLVDGIPSFGYQLGTIGEIVLGIYGLYILTISKI